MEVETLKKVCPTNNGAHLLESETVFVNTYPKPQVLNPEPTLKREKEFSGETADCIEWKRSLYSGAFPACAQREGRAPASALEATQGQNDSFLSQHPYTCYLEEVASVGD